MIAEKHREWFVLIAVSGGGAVVVGILLGWLSKSAGWGFSPLVIAVGPPVGLLVQAFGWPNSIERVTTGIAASALGICLFAWTSHTPGWRAATAIARDEIDDLCIRTTALQLCYERRIMGVFSFDDVPELIRCEARQRVAQSSEAEKLALCDRTFGRRINNEPGERARKGAVLNGGIWVLLSLAISAAPDTIRRWLACS